MKSLAVHFLRENPTRALSHDLRLMKDMTCTLDTNRRLAEDAKQIAPASDKKSDEAVKKPDATAAKAQAVNTKADQALNTGGRLGGAGS